MSNLVEYELARQIWRYAGQKLEYIDLTGKRGCGILEAIEVHKETQEIIALFRSFKYTNILPCLFPPTKVPLRQVILPNTRRTTSTSAESTTRQSSARQKFKNFQYYDNLYEITYIENFKTGDEVVWTRYSSGDVAYMGFIVVTAERQDRSPIASCTSDYQEVAIIKFDVTPFTYTGEKAPGHFPYLPGIENTFLIPMTELLKLSEWVAVTAKVEDNSHRDLWHQREATKDEMKEDQRLNIKTDSRMETPVSSRDFVTNEQNLIPPVVPQSSNSTSEINLQRTVEKVQVERSSSALPTKPTMPWNLDAMSSQSQKGTCIPEQLECFHETTQSDNDTTKFSPPTWENEWLLPINQAKIFSKIQKGGGFAVGIQGKNNSCSVDASLVALFLFNKTFDSCLHQMENEENDKFTSRVKKVMRNDIVLSMRQEFHVRHEKVLGLRSLLGQEINLDCVNCVGVEEFLTDLFIKLDTPPLLSYDDGDGDYFHRIRLPPTWIDNRCVPYLTVQTLLEKSFETYNVNLTTLPYCGLIIKLPISDGSLIPCTGVIANLTLNLSSILSSTNIPSAGDNVTMNLRSVICQRDGHYVAFVRTGLEKNSPWIFLDSNPAMCAFAVILPDLDMRIEQAVEVTEHGKPVSNPYVSFEPYYQQIYDPGYQNFSLFKNAYACLYV